MNGITRGAERRSKVLPFSLTMVKRSIRKARQFSYLVIFSLFVLFSLLINQRTSRVMLDEESATRPSFPAYMSGNSSIFISARILDASDWSKACSSNQNYKRRLRSSTRNQNQKENKQEKCDLFTGRWVYDNVSYPLYSEGGCPYMSDQLACTKHGRPDVEYQRMRWQPHGCDLKRWNGTEMLEKLRDKRLMFVGDSLNREADGLNALTLALETWADWVSSSINPLRQRVFFVTMSPTHLWKREWQSGSEGNCFNEMTPINNDSYWGSGSDLSTMQMVKDTLGKLGSKVTVLNITQLSEYRKDGHPSIFRKFWETFSPHQLANPETYSDCIHWCLPGVPDIWNELLFNLL